MVTAGRAAGQGTAPPADWRSIDADFARPPAAFRLIQYGGHDGSAVPVAQMATAGIGGVNLFMQKTGYLQTEEAWDNLEANILAAKAAGLQVWMGDDNGYPSGMAGGLVVAADPAFEVRCLAEVAVNGEGPGPVILDLPEGAEMFLHASIYPLVDGQAVLEQGQPVSVNPGRVEATGLAGPWRLCAFARHINREATQAASTAASFSHTGRYPNLLNEAAMETFVSLTHQEYARRFGPLNDKIDVFYTNEPNLMTLWWTQPPSERPGGASFIPWDTELPLRFQQRHGYDLMPMLPALFGGNDAASRLTRRHFYETVGAVLAENFSQRIADWAEQNGVRTAGHPLLEENMLHHVIGCGDMVRFQQDQQIQSCDVPMPDRGASWNHWIPKLASSVAQYQNSTTVSVLLDPIIGRSSPNLVPTPADFRRIVNMAVFSGANQFQTYLRWADYNPAIYRGMSDYTGRLAVVLRGARSAAKVAMYYPIESFQAGFVPSPYVWSNGTLFPPAWVELRTMQASQNNTARSLTEAGIDFNWLHGDWVLNAAVEGDCLVVGQHRYSAVVMPRLSLLPLDVASKLKQFQDAGGKIIWVNTRPTLGDSPSEHAAVTALFAGQATVLPRNVVGTLGAVVPQDFELRVEGPAVVEGAVQEFFTARFVRDGRRITHLVNNGLAALDASLTLADGGTRRVAVYNPLDGSIIARELPGTLTIAPSSSLLVVENPASLPSLAVINGTFSDHTGLSTTTPAWLGGFPAAWTGGNNSSYAISLTNGVAYANLQTLAPNSPFTPIRQNVGTVERTSDVQLTFTLTNLQAGVSLVGVAVYANGQTNLGSASITGPGTFTHTVRAVAPGTPLQIAFWRASASDAMGLTDVRIADTATAFRWNGGTGGVWSNAGGGWLDEWDESAANWNNAKPAVAKFTTPAAATAVMVDAGGVTAGSVEVDAADHVFSGGPITLTNSSWSVASGRMAAVSNTLSGTGGLAKTGAGTLTLTGPNNYSGATTVEAGSLVIHGDHSAATGEVVVRSGAALGGDGILGGNLVLEPGARWVFDPQATITVPGAIRGGFTLAELAGLDAGVPAGRYTLIDGAVDAAEFSPVGEASAQDLGGGRRAWFEVGAGRLELVVSEQQRFTDWLQQYDLSGADAEWTAAPAGDGISNLLKYAFNLDPLRHEGSGQFPGGFRSLPYLAPGPAGDHLEFIYYRDPRKIDITLTPVWSKHLDGSAPWNEVPDHEVIGSSGAIEQWRARIPMDGGRGFMKLRIDLE